MTWKILSLLAGVSLCGCAVVPPSGFYERLTSPTKQVDNLPAIDSAQVAELQSGSQVEIAGSDPHDHLAGTVLHASSEGVVLLNCVWMERDASDQVVMKRRIPSHWISVRRIARVLTIAPPPEDFVASSVEIDTSESTEYSHGRMGIEFGR